MNIIQEAINIATNAHKGQFRKYTNEPYIVHPFAVAGLVAGVTNINIDMVVAALLHDVVEDTNIEIEYIDEIFGHIISNLVYNLTDQSRLEDGNRTIRKKIDRDFLTKTCKDTKTIKLADIIDNTRTIIIYDPGFSKKYMKENRDLLPILKEGDESLYKIVKEIILNYFKQTY